MNQTRSFSYALLGLLLVVPLLAGCSGKDAEGGALETRAVYVCTETMEEIVAEEQETPALNPKTGRRTLMPGLYCQKCERWHPTPPLDVLQRNPGAGACPKTGTSLTIDGPLPK